MTDLGPHGRALLDAARHADDHEMKASRERVRGALGRRLGAAAVGLGTVTAATTTTATAGATVTMGLFGKLVIGLVAFGVVAGGVVVTRARNHAAPAPVPSAPVIIARPPIALPDPTPVSSAIAVPTSTIAPPSEPIVTATPAPPPPVVTAISAPTAKAAPTASTLSAELVALRQANEKLVAGEPAAALAILDAAPSGTLGEERQGLRLLARCALGQADAKTSARSFLEAHPSSPLAARLRSSCGLE